jgi:Concanavalin A-like lectin/glucanases superfamily
MKIHLAILSTFVSLALPTISSAQSLTLGLVAHYELDGNALDSSSYGANGTIFGSLTPVPDRFGNPGGAFGFEKNAYISLPNTTLLNGATQAAITGWVRNRLLPGEDGFVLAAGDIRAGLDPYTVRFNGNEFSEAGFTDTLKGPFGPDRSVGFGGGSGLFVAQNAWFSFVSQFSSVGEQTTYQLYLNGQLARQENYARSAQITFDRPMPIEIGAHVGSFYPTEFRGDIDDLRIYDRALTPEEIAAVSAPEPSTAILLLSGAALLIRRRRIQG